MTIKEVAALAGVSPAAVSRYLNGGSLSEEKRAAVKKAIEETGYRPNPMAQTMRTGRINQVGVIVPRLHSDSVSRITAGATQKLFEEGYMTLLGCTDHDPEKENRYLHLMQESQVAGIILMGSIFTPEIAEAVRSCRVPVVITGQNFEGLPCVFHDDFNAVRELTALMIRKGAKRIVYIGVLEEDKAAGLARREGCQEALRSAGFDADNMPRRIADFEAQSGYRAMLELLAENPDLDGVICATDIIAHGAMKALKEKGRRIPEDVMIAGVGDNWADLISTPTLTTAMLHQKRCGLEAAKLLLRLIEEEENKSGSKEDAPHKSIRLGYRIIERDSLRTETLKKQEGEE